MTTQAPLEGLLVLDFSQFLAGPSAALRLADLGATVIKVERPVQGELCRQLYISDLEIDGDSTLFHTINRNKRSYAADLKSSSDLHKVRQLIARADVMIENFRPGVMERIGLGFDAVRALNQRIVYASVTGYGPRGPWVELPGQDLLAQSRSGLVWLSGDGGQGPVPVGLALADILTGAHMVQGILAALVRRGLGGTGGRVEVSLLESALDFQFEVLTTHLNDGGQPPRRAMFANAHAYLGAPYGIYATRDGHIALAMGSIETLAKALDCGALAPYFDRSTWFKQRDAIKQILKEHLVSQDTQYWLDRLVAVDYWCAPVMSWPELLAHEGFKTLDFLQDVRRSSGAVVRTTRCPIRIDGRRAGSALAAPKVGEHNAWVEQTFGITQAQETAHVV
jgi:crotonobetainyl-CoA:carnitine CoA-transferase CaiB-like acyl-CoA transferase